MLNTAAYSYMVKDIGALTGGITFMPFDASSGWPLAPQACLFLEGEVAAQIVRFGDDAYNRFRSAKRFAEFAIGRLLRSLEVLPKFEVIFEDIYLLIGFNRPSERFFISVCFDLGNDPDRPNPPNGGLPAAIVLYIMTPDPHLVLRVLAQLCVFGRNFGVENFLTLEARRFRFSTMLGLGSGKYQIALVGWALLMRKFRRWRPRPT